MVSNKQLIMMLNEAMITEEIKVMPLLDRFIRKLDESKVDATIKSEIEKRIWILKQETIAHALILTGMLKQIVGEGESEY